MINLLSAEFYKLKKSISLKVSGGLTVFFVFFMYVLHVLLESNLTDNVDEAMAEEISKMDILYMIKQMFANNNTIIFVTIFVCIFALGDYSSGAVKNFAGKGFKRSEIYLARFLSTEVGAILIYLLTAVAVFLGGIIFQGIDEVSGQIFYDFISYLLMHIIYVISYTAIIVMVCEITRNMATGISISILGIMLFSGFLFHGIDIVIKVLGSSFKISNYWIMAIISDCPLKNIPMNFITSSCIVALGWLVISMAFGMFHFKWKDIK